jgi:spore coat-associated protein N
MKKILLSLLTMGVVSVGAVYSTAAYFSDTETSTDNSIVAGTIDISVDGENPWESTAEHVFTNTLPGDTESISFTVANVGNNDVVLWKKVAVTAQVTGTQSEPECDAEGGAWAAGVCTGNTEDNNLAGSYNYEMTVDGTALIDAAWGVNMEDVDDIWVPLGKIAVGGDLDIVQNYHFDELAGNVLQGDEMTFDLVLYAEQIDAPGPAHTSNGVVLENKTDTDWAPIVNDGRWGLLTWDASGNYRLRAWGLDMSTTYRVAYWDGLTEFQISSLETPVSGELDFIGTETSLNVSSDAKYWLRPATGANLLTLWESNLVN